MHQNLYCNGKENRVMAPRSIRLFAAAMAKYASIFGAGAICRSEGLRSVAERINGDNPAALFFNGFYDGNQSDLCGYRVPAPENHGLEL